MTCFIETDVLTAVATNYLSENITPYSRVKVKERSIENYCFHLQGRWNQEKQAASLVFFVRYEVFTAVTIKNGVFWDVAPCGSCKNRRFGGM
jgi:hypothetical protein